MSAKRMQPGVATDPARAADYVTFTVGDQLFGLPILRVQDVFMPDRLTRVPLASPEIAGVLNLRGRILTAIDMRCRLGLAPRPHDGSRMAVGIDCDGEAYALLIDGIGEVLKLGDDTREPLPVNLDRRLAQVCSGMHRLEDRLLIVLDIDRVLDVGNEAIAA
jgi:purine-binding chemotaxis protein CheW